MPMDTLGGEATIRWDLSIGVGGWGSLKLSDRLRTWGETAVKRQAGQCGPPPVQPLGSGRRRCPQPTNPSGEQESRDKVPLAPSPTLHPKTIKGIHMQDSPVTGTGEWRWQ